MALSSHTVMAGKDVFVDAPVVRCSGQAQALTLPPHRNEMYGDAVPQTKGTFNDYEQRSIHVWFTAVGNMDADLEIQRIPTRPRGGGSNTGDGTCELELAATFIMPAIITLTYNGTDWDVTAELQDGTPVTPDTVTNDTGWNATVFGSSVRIQMTSGTTLWADGDTFIVYCAQAQWKWSTDGTNWSIAYDLENTGTWQGYVPDCIPTGETHINGGIWLRLTMGYSSAPIVVNDKVYISSRYKNGLNALAIQTLFDKFQSRRCDRLMFLADYLTGTATVDLLMMMYHNLSSHADGARVKVFGVDDADILKLYPDEDDDAITSVFGSTITISVQATITSNEFDGGYLHIVNGACMQNAYEILSHPAASAGTTCVITVSGTPATDGVTDRDSWLIEPQVTWADYEDTSGAFADMDQVGDGDDHYGAFLTSHTSRGWVMVIVDPSNSDGIVKTSFARLCEACKPATTNGDNEIHQRLGDALEPFQAESNSIANVSVRYNRGVHSKPLPIEWVAISINAKEQLFELEQFVGNLDRARAVMMIPDVNDFQSVIIGWMTGIWADGESKQAGSGRTINVSSMLEVLCID